MKVFDWNKFRKINIIAVHCKTMAEAKDFEEKAKNVSYDLFKDDKIQQWKNYTTDTVFYNDNTYSDMEYALNNGYRVIEWSDYMQSGHKVDCNITENYFKEKARMTEDCSIDCENCPFYNVENDIPVCEDTGIEMGETRRAINIVQRWSDEHPPKTYRDDFYEKLPKAEKNQDGYPTIGACNIYPELREHCKENKCYGCWDMPYNE